MKHVVQDYYICEKCGAQFRYQERAEECEQSHLNGEIKKYTYSICTPDPRYPSSLDVRFSDGCVYRYSIVREIKEGEQ